MPPIVGDRLFKESSKRAFTDAMHQVRQALYRTGRRSEGDAEREVGRILEDVMIRSEKLEEEIVRYQSEATLSNSQLSTMREGLRGVINDNRQRISQWEYTIRGRDRVEREDFLWKTWDWLSQSLTWLQGKAG